MFVCFSLNFFCCFLVDVLCVILGQDSGSVCKDDSARFKKTSPKPVLSILGRLHAAPEVEFYFTKPPNFSSSCFALCVFALCHMHQMSHIQKVEFVTLR